VVEGPTVLPPLHDFPYSTTNSSSSNNRFSKWIALMALSLVAWLAMITNPRHRKMDDAETWTLSFTTICLFFSIVGVIGGCICPRNGFFMGGIFCEMIIIGCIMIAWILNLPVMMNPANTIAISFSDYLNANLYFGSWSSFLCSGMIIKDIMEERYGYDVLTKIVVSTIIHGQHGKWYGLIFTSSIVTISSIRVFNAFDCTKEIMFLAPVCRQTKHGISAGVSGTALAILTAMVLNSRCGSSSCWKTVCQGWISILMVIVWSVGLGYITFGEGPGQNVGNLYFSTWISFTLSILLAAESYRNCCYTLPAQEQEEEHRQQQHHHHQQHHQQEQVYPFPSPDNDDGRESSSYHTRVGDDDDDYDDQEVDTEYHHRRRIDAVRVSATMVNHSPYQTEML